MKYKHSSYAFTLIICALSHVSGALAVEGMSAEEVSMREEHDRLNMELSKKLYECFARNNVNPRDIDEAVCLTEKAELKKAGEKFNSFMREKEAKSTPAEKREEFHRFEEMYSEYAAQTLKDLHRQHCITKWGSAATTECQAIASQIRRKELIEQYNQ